LEKKGKIDIGLDTNCLSSASKFGVTLAAFNLLGKHPAESERLKILDNSGPNFG
jgi:hypothetical protein